MTIIYIIAGLSCISFIAGFVQYKRTYKNHVEYILANIGRKNINL